MLHYVLHNMYNLKSHNFKMYIRYETFHHKYIITVISHILIKSFMHTFFFTQGSPFHQKNDIILNVHKIIYHNTIVCMLHQNHYQWFYFILSKSPKAANNSESDT